MSDKKMKTVTLLEIKKENTEYKYSKYKVGQIWEVYYTFDEMWIAVYKNGKGDSPAHAIYKGDADIIYEEQEEDI